MTLSRKLVAGLSRLQAAPLPTDVLDAAKLHLLDALGVGLAASTLKPGLPYRRYGEGIAHGGPASVLGFAEGASAADAAMINGGLIHSLEYDDTHTGSIVHGSSVLAAVALAVAEREGASGRECLGAYAAGWETLVRLGLASPGGYQARGFHVTSVAGALAAALVAAQLGNLDEDRNVAAIGIALSQVSGVFEFLSNGSSVKSLHPGWAAHAGVIAADFAQAGMTGPETALEGRHGLFHVFAGDEAAAGRLAASIATLGEIWHLPDVAYKLSSSCHYIHPFIEAAGLLCEQGLSAERIAGLTCHVPVGMAALICEPWELKLAPPTGHAARWSLPVVVAARILRGSVELDLFEDGIAPDILALAWRFAWEPMPDSAFPQRFEAGISVTCVGGETLSQRIDDVYGNCSRPARREDVLRKFAGNAGRALAPDRVDALRDAVLSLDAAADLSGLRSALRAASTRRQI
jgi:2-methylcitrate dehydratase PrpD